MTTDSPWLAQPAALNDVISQSQYTSFYHDCSHVPVLLRCKTPLTFLKTVWIRTDSSEIRLPDTWSSREKDFQSYRIIDRRYCMLTHSCDIITWDRPDYWSCYYTLPLACPGYHLHYFISGQHIPCPFIWQGYNWPACCMQEISWNSVAFLRDDVVIRHKTILLARTDAQYPYLQSSYLPTLHFATILE